jgi:hypothetical protein
VSLNELFAFGTTVTTCDSDIGKLVTAEPKKWYDQNA